MSTVSTVYTDTVTIFYGIQKTVSNVYSNDCQQCLQITGNSTKCKQDTVTMAAVSTRYSYNCLQNTVQLSAVSRGYSKNYIIYINNGIQCNFLQDTGTSV